MTGSKRAKHAVKSTTRKKTSTGHAGHIGQNGAVRCGGAVEREAWINLAVSTVNTKQRTMKRPPSI